jgi:opacity protein-like surface antigen
MKKLLFAAALAVSASAATAQVAPTFGLKAGLNFADYKRDLSTEDESSDRRIAYHFGAFANVPLGGMFRINPELLLSAEGGEVKSGSGSTEVKSVLKLNYINVPVMFQYSNPSGFFAETGPQIGFLASAKNKTETGGDNEQEIDVKDAYSGTNISWGIGLGYKLPAGIGIGARYNYGLSNISDVNGIDIKTSAIQLSLLYSFGK